MLIKKWYFLSYVVLIFFQELAIAQTTLVEKIVAVVGNDIVLKSEIDAKAEFLAYQNGATEIDPELWKRVLEATIDEKIIIAKSIRDSIQINQAAIQMEVKSRIEYLKKRLGSELAMQEYFGKPINMITRDIRNQIKDKQRIAIMQQRIASEISVSNKDVKEFYKLYKDSLPELPAQVELARILIFPKIDSISKRKAFDKILIIKEKLSNQDMSFEDLAIKYSEDPGSAAEGGDLGFIKKGEFVKSFEEEAFKLRENEVSEIIETKFGYHIVKLLERKNDQINPAHILVKFDQTKLDEKTTVEKLKTIRREVLGGNLSFSLAAMRFSEDEESAQKGGNLLDPQTKSMRLNLVDLPDHVKDAIAEIKVNEVSMPMKVQIPEKDKEGYQILLLKEKTKAHKMSLEQDYSMIQRIVLQQRQAEYMKKWLSNLRNEIYWALK